MLALGMDTRTGGTGADAYDYSTLCAPIKSCGDGKFKNALGETSGDPPVTVYCKNCAEGCKACTDSAADKCTAPKDGWFLPANPGPVTACHGSCKTCTNATACVTCRTG